MERIMKTPLLFLLAVLQICSSLRGDCPSDPDKDLACYTDYNKTITCVWNSAPEIEHTNATCTVNATLIKPSRTKEASCVLKPPHVSRPAQRNCSMEFKTRYIFQTFDTVNVSLRCTPAKQILSISFRPACHIKLNPPGKPSINGTTVYWFPQEKPSNKIKDYETELQWRRWDQSWSDPSVQEKQMKKPTCHWACEAQLDIRTLTLGERHKARIRVKAVSPQLVSLWSDWSPAASWSSSVGITRPSKLASGLSGGIPTMIVIGAALALILVVMLFRNEKVTRVYKKIRVPDPGKSFLKDNWTGPHFTTESLLSPKKQEDISSVEVVSTVDAVTFCSKEAALLEKMRNESSSESTSASFLNPSYSHLCSPSRSPPTTANLEPCAGDTPHGASPSLRGGKTTEQDREQEGLKELELLQLLSKGNTGEPVPVISDYEKVEKLQVQNLDSRTCGGEVREERVETGNISADESQNKRLEEKEEKENRFIVDFQKLFGGGENVFGKGSIQICSDYEQVQKLPPESPELSSLDSGVSSGSEERVSQEESLEDANESTHFLFPPPLDSSALPRSRLFLPQLG